MKKTIIATALILGTTALASSGIKLINQKGATKQTILPSVNQSNSSKEIASAD